MSYMLITGIVLTVIPVALIIGFASFIFMSFVKDDDDAAAVLKITFITMLIGLSLIAGHYVVQLIS